MRPSISNIFRVMIIFYSAMISIAIAQQSQPISPQQQPINQENRNKDAPSERGTDKNPLTVKILPAEKGKDEIEREEKERHDKLILDKRLVDDTKRIADETTNLVTETDKLGRYTKYLMIFTLGMMIAASVQVVLFVWQLRVMQETVKDAKVAAHAASRSADALVSAERGRLFVEITEQVGGTSANNRGHKPEITVIFRNLGKTPALLGVMNYTFDLFDLTEMPSYARTQVFSKQYISAGESSNPLHLKFAGVYQEDQIAAVSTKQVTVRFFGEISYRDFINPPEQQAHIHKFLFELGPEGFIRLWTKNYSEDT